MAVHWKSQDAEFHMRRAEAERRAALNSETDAAEIAHRQLASEHESAAHSAIEGAGVPAFNEAEFLNFVARLAHAGEATR